MTGGQEIFSHIDLNENDYRGVTNGGANAETPPAWQITLL